MLILSLSSKLNWSYYMSKKMSFDAFCEISFFQGCLYLYELGISPCVEYCCHVWASTPKCYLNING